MLLEKLSLISNEQIIIKAPTMQTKQSYWFWKWVLFGSLFLLIKKLRSISNNEIEGEIIRKNKITFLFINGFSVKKFEVAKINNPTPVIHKPAYQNMFFLVG